MCVIVNLLEVCQRECIRLVLLRRFFLKIAVFIMILLTTLSAQLLILAPLGRAVAYTTPVSRYISKFRLILVLNGFQTTQCTNGCNAISKPTLQELVQAAQAYIITWTPTTTNTVTILLLQGPSTNAAPLYTLAEKLANNGTFPWTPSADLQADVSHYGLQIIDDTDGTFQCELKKSIREHELTD